MIQKKLTAARIETILTALKGPSGNDGLAFRPLPVRKVLFPLLRFVEDAGALIKPVIAARDELFRRYQAAEGDEAQIEAIEAELQDLMAQEFEMRIQPICGQCLDDREDITLADLQLLSTFFPTQDAEETPAPDIQAV